jgi:phage/plasmid-associated DNA primase
MRRGPAQRTRPCTGFFSFQPTHKLWLLGNHRPEVDTGGFAFWRRMRLIPFERVVPETARSITWPVSWSVKKDQGSWPGSSTVPAGTQAA